jgi:cell division protease FtsH
VFLLLLVLVQAYYMAPAGKSVPYSEFKDLVKKGAIQEVTVGDQLIHGTLKQPPPDDPKGSTKFTTTRVDDPKLTEELEGHSVKYSGEIANRWLPVLVVGWIVPLILFVAIWGFFLRRL